MAQWTQKGFQIMEDDDGFYTPGGSNTDYINATEVNAIIMANQGNKVISGAEVIAISPTPDLTVNVQAGIIHVNGTSLPSFAGDATFDISAHVPATPSESKYVLISVDSSGTITATPGADATTGNQVMPVNLEDEVLLAIILLTYNQSQIDDNSIADGRIFTPTADPHGDNQKSYWGDNGDFQILHDSSNTFLNNITGTFHIVNSSDVVVRTTDGFYIQDADDSNVNLFSFNTNISGGRTMQIGQAADLMAITTYGTFFMESISVNAGLGFLSRHSTGGEISYRTFAEVLSDIGVTFGLAIGNTVKVDDTLVVGEYLKVLGTGVESKTFAEVRTDLGMDLRVSLPMFTNWRDGSGGNWFFTATDEFLLNNSNDNDDDVFIYVEISEGLKSLDFKIRQVVSTAGSVESVVSCFIEEINDGVTWTIIDSDSVTINDGESPLNSTINIPFTGTIDATSQYRLRINKSHTGTPLAHTVSIYNITANY